MKGVKMFLVSYNSIPLNNFGNVMMRGRLVVVVGVVVAI